jgi:gp16 family phage-associated protein
MTNPLHQPLPYPQTRQSAAAALRAAGICMNHWARDLGLTRDAVVDALRGKDKGLRGTAHRAAVALGLKPGPDAVALPAPAVRSAEDMVDAVVYNATAALLDFAAGHRPASATLDALLPALLLLSVAGRAAS